MRNDNSIVSTPQLPGPAEVSYQTAPLVEYNSALRQRASELFRRIGDLIGRSRVKEYKGSFSIFAASTDATAAKLVIYEAGKGRMNGPDIVLADGVYILVRAPDTATTLTIGIAPKHHERFAYFRLVPEQNLSEMAAFIAACAGSQ